MVKGEAREKAKAGGDWELLVLRGEGKPLRDLDRRMMGLDLGFNQKFAVAVKE